MTRNSSERLPGKDFKGLVSERTGIQLCGRDDHDLFQAISRRMEQIHLSSPDLYYQLLLGDTEESRKELAQITILLTTGETYFLRDKGQFALLKNTILPELIRRRRATRSLRIWSAACASGEEAYSLAMLLDELPAQRADWNILILGTDINPEAIEKARRGRYTQWSFRMVDTDLQEKYFRYEGGQWELSERIRAMVTFRTGDLLHDNFPDAASGVYDMDLILCRNVFIYLDSGTVSRIAAKLADTLVEGGYLITGHGELHAQHPESLCSKIFPETMAYQKGGIEDAGAGIGLPMANPDWADAGIPASPKTAKSKPSVSHFPSTTLVSPSSLPPPPSRMEAAWKHANLGELDKAADICREEIRSASFNGEPYYLLAQISEERGNSREAKELLKKVIYLDPGFIAAYLDLGEIYQREKDLSRARKVRDAARDILKTLPADAVIDISGSSTAGELLLYLEKSEAHFGNRSAVTPA